MKQRYEQKKIAYCKALDHLRNIKGISNAETNDKLFWYIGESIRTIQVYFHTTLSSSPAEIRTECDKSKPIYNYDSKNGLCKNWDNLDFFTTTISILSLQLAIEEWIATELGEPEKANPSFRDHYNLVIEQIANDKNKEKAKEFFDAFNLLRNKIAHRHSNTTISKENNKELKRNGFYCVNQIKNEKYQLFLDPDGCVDIIENTMNKLTDIRNTMKRKGGKND